MGRFEKEKKKGDKKTRSGTHHLPSFLIKHTDKESKRERESERNIQCNYSILHSFLSSVQQSYLIDLLEQVNDDNRTCIWTIIHIRRHDLSFEHEGSRRAREKRKW